MAAIKQYFRPTVLFLALGSTLFVGVWIGRTSVPDQLLGGPVAAQANPLALQQKSGTDAKNRSTKDYQLWQELAYLSALFNRLSHTYHGLEQQALGGKGHLIPPSGEDPMRWWIEICDPGNPFCEWDVEDFARCEVVLARRVEEVFGRMGKGIARADALMSKREMLRKNRKKKFKFMNTVLSVPPSTPAWLDADALKTHER